MEDCKRFSVNSISTRKRLPICPEHLHALVNKFAGVDATLADIRDLCFCLVAFAGFLRFNELCNLQCRDIDFKDTYFLFLILGEIPTSMGLGLLGWWLELATLLVCFIYYADMLHQWG